MAAMFDTGVRANLALASDRQRQNWNPRPPDHREGVEPLDPRDPSHVAPWFDVKTSVTCQAPSVVLVEGQGHDESQEIKGWRRISIDDKGEYRQMTATRGTVGDCTETETSTDELNDGGRRRTCKQGAGQQDWERTELQCNKRAWKRTSAEERDKDDWKRTGPREGTKAGWNRSRRGASNEDWKGIGGSRTDMLHGGSNAHGGKKDAAPSQVLRRLELSEEGFFQLLFCDRWAPGCLLRVLRGPLLDTLLPALAQLKDRLDVISCVTTAYVSPPLSGVTGANRPVVKLVEPERWARPGAPTAGEVRVELDTFVLQQPRSGTPPQPRRSGTPPQPRRSGTPPQPRSQPGAPTAREVRVELTFGPQQPRSGTPSQPRSQPDTHVTRCVHVGTPYLIDHLLPPIIETPLPSSVCDVTQRPVAASRSVATKREPPPRPRIPRLSTVTTRTGTGPSQQHSGLPPHASGDTRPHSIPGATMQHPGFGGGTSGDSLLSHPSLPRVRTANKQRRESSSQQQREQHDDHGDSEGGKEDRPGEEGGGGGQRLDREGLRARPDILHPGQQGPRARPDILHPGQQGPRARPDILHPGQQGPRARPDILHPGQQEPRARPDILHPGQLGPRARPDILHSEQQGPRARPDILHSEQQGPRARPDILHSEQQGPRARPDILHPGQHRHGTRLLSRLSLLLHTNDQPFSCPPKPMKARQETDIGSRHDWGEKDVSTNSLHGKDPPHSGFQKLTRARQKPALWSQDEREARDMSSNSFPGTRGEKYRSLKIVQTAVRTTANSSKESKLRKALVATASDYHLGMIDTGLPSSDRPINLNLSLDFMKSERFARTRDNKKTTVLTDKPSAYKEQSGKNPPLNVLSHSINQSYLLRLSLRTASIASSSVIDLTADEVGSEDYSDGKKSKQLRQRSTRLRHCPLPLKESHHAEKDHPYSFLQRQMPLKTSSTRKHVDTHNQKNASLERNKKHSASSVDSQQTEIHWQNKETSLNQKDGDKQNILRHKQDSSLDPLQYETKVRRISSDLGKDGRERQRRLTSIDDTQDSEYQLHHRKKKWNASPTLDEVNQFMHEKEGETGQGFKGNRWSSSPPFEEYIRHLQDSGSGSDYLERRGGGGRRQEDDGTGRRGEGRQGSPTRRHSGRRESGETDRRDGSQYGSDRRDESRYGSDRRDGSQYGRDRRDGSRYGSDRRDGSRDDRRDGSQYGSDRRDGAQYGSDERDGSQYDSDRRDGSRAEGSRDGGGGGASKQKSRRTKGDEDEDEGGASKQKGRRTKGDEDEDEGGASKQKGRRTKGDEDEDEGGASKHKGRRAKGDGVEDGGGASKHKGRRAKADGDEDGVGASKQKGRRTRRDGDEDRGSQEESDMDKKEKGGKGKGGKGKGKDGAKRGIKLAGGIDGEYGNETENDMNKKEKGGKGKGKGEDSKKRSTNTAGGNDGDDDDETKNDMNQIKGKNGGGKKGCVKGKETRKGSEKMAEAEAHTYTGKVKRQPELREIVTRTQQSEVARHATMLERARKAHLFDTDIHKDRSQTENLTKLAKKAKQLKINEIAKQFKLNEMAKKLNLFEMTKQSKVIEKAKQTNLRKTAKQLQLDYTMEQGNGYMAAATLTHFNEMEPYRLAAALAQMAMEVESDDEMVMEQVESNQTARQTQESRMAKRAVSNQTARESKESRMMKRAGLSFGRVPTDKPREVDGIVLARRVSKHNRLVAARRPNEWGLTPHEDRALQWGRDVALGLGWRDTWHLARRFPDLAGGVCDSKGVRRALLIRRYLLMRLLQQTWDRRVPDIHPEALPSDVSSRPKISLSLRDVKILNIGPKEISLWGLGPGEAGVLGMGPNDVKLWGLGSRGVVAAASRRKKKAGVTLSQAKLDDMKGKINGSSETVLPRIFCRHTTHKPIRGEVSDTSLPDDTEDAGLSDGRDELEGENADGQDTNFNSNAGMESQDRGCEGSRPQHKQGNPGEHGDEYDKYGKQGNPVKRETGSKKSQPAAGPLPPIPPGKLRELQFLQYKHHTQGAANIVSSQSSHQTRSSDHVCRLLLDIMQLFVVRRERASSEGHNKVTVTFTRRAPGDDCFEGLSWVDPQSIVAAACRTLTAE